MKFQARARLNFNWRGPRALSPENVSFFRDMKASHYLIKNLLLLPGEQCQLAEWRNWNEARGAIKYWRAAQRRLNATKELIMATLCHSNAILCALLRRWLQMVGRRTKGRCWGDIHLRRFPRLYNIKRKFASGEALKLPITAQYTLVWPQREN